MALRTLLTGPAAAARARPSRTSLCALTCWPRRLMITAQGADLSGNALASVSGLARNEELSWLKLSGNKLTTLAELRPLRKLRTLNAGDNELTSLEGVGALTTLRRKARQMLGVSAEARTLPSSRSGSVSSRGCRARKTGTG